MVISRRRGDARTAAGAQTRTRTDAAALTDAAVDALLPLKPVWFHILLTLAEQPTHGYAIRQAVEARTDGRIRLWPTTLYGSIGQLEDAALIELWDPPELRDELPRHFYRLTALGRRVLLAETQRLDRLVQLARAATARRRLT
jgi:DNA-binding PadR family transcriptional regulator